MDSLKSFFTWPVCILALNLKFFLGCTIAIGPLAIQITTKGMKSLSKFSDLFDFFSVLPLGRDVFSGLVNFVAPYSGSISATVLELNSKECRIELYDLPW